MPDDTTYHLPAIGSYIRTSEGPVQVVSIRREGPDAILDTVLRRRDPRFNGNVPLLYRNVFPDEGSIRAVTV